MNFIDAICEGDGVRELDNSNCAERLLEVTQNFNQKVLQYGVDHGEGYILHKLLNRGCMLDHTRSTCLTLYRNFHYSYIGKPRFGILSYCLGKTVTYLCKHNTVFAPLFVSQPTLNSWQRALFVQTSLGKLIYGGESSRPAALILQ